MKVLRVILGVIAGYALMVLLITLVQEVWLGGIGWYKSSLAELAGGGAGTFASAVAGGFVAAWIGAGRRLAAPVVMCALVILETTALTISGTLDGPLWFDIAASASLLAGILLGWWLLTLLKALPSATPGKQALSS